jgi:hypothetical protein
MKKIRLKENFSAERLNSFKDTLDGHDEIVDQAFLNLWNSDYSDESLMKLATAVEDEIVTLNRISKEALGLMKSKV